jgi:hypothetical protein
MLHVSFVMKGGTVYKHNDVDPSTAH